MPWNGVEIASFSPKRRPNSTAASRLSLYFIWWIKCCVRLFVVKKNKAAAASSRTRPSKRAVNVLAAVLWKLASGKVIWQSRQRHCSLFGKGSSQAMHKRGKKSVTKSAQRLRIGCRIFKIGYVYRVLDMVFYLISLKSEMTLYNLEQSQFDEQMYRWLFEKVKVYFYEYILFCMRFE